MCLILFAWDVHPKYKLILAANRDEFYERPTSDAEFWSDYPHILAGRDLKAGGTWLGITKDGKFAALTNYYELNNKKPDAPSRGDLTADFLKMEVSPEQYLQSLLLKAGLYNGFNLLIGHPNGLTYYSNIENLIRPLKKGIFGLSNHALDTPWPKVKRGKILLQKVMEKDDLQIDQLFDILMDRTKPTDEELPDTGLAIELERELSSIFIQTDTYGTRCSTVLLIDRQNNITFVERQYQAGKILSPDRIFRFFTGNNSKEIYPNPG